MKDYSIILVYLTNEQKSWPIWKRERTDGPQEIKRMVDSITGMFADFRPNIMLNSHSGGGSFIFGYMDAVKEIPMQVQRIAFIDSDYGYEDSLYGEKIINWLKTSNQNHLNVLAYNDSVVIFNGKPLVSATGGTWYKSQMIQRKLSRYFTFIKTTDTGLIKYQALSNKIDIILKTNPEGKIYHTELVARNGFIHTVLSGTKYERKAAYTYWGNRVYGKFIRP